MPVRFLRLLALGILALGLLMKPLLSIACEMNDLRWAAGGGHTLVSTDAQPDAGNACCPGQTCSECCAMGVGLPVDAGPSGEAPVRAVRFAIAVNGFDPAPHPVAVRPPIAA